jgi:hypothetical protein
MRVHLRVEMALRGMVGGKATRVRAAPNCDLGETDMKAPKYIAFDEMVRAIGPVTRRELAQIRCNREKTAPALELTLGGGTERTIHEFEHERRAVRESYIANRPDRMAAPRMISRWRGCSNRPARASTGA